MKKKKTTLFLLLAFLALFLLLADLLFKGAVYKQLPAHLQESLDQYQR